MLAGDRREEGIAMAGEFDVFFRPSPLWQYLKKKHEHRPFPFKTPVGGLNLMSPPSCTTFIEKRERSNSK
jgi:hypothetical protein